MCPAREERGRPGSRRYEKGEGEKSSAVVELGGDRVAHGVDDVIEAKIEPGLVGVDLFVLAEDLLHVGEFNLGRCFNEGVGSAGWASPADLSQIARDEGDVSRSGIL